ncbi:MAG: hypothetical protein WCK34_01740 [Bacteroidota bacterium]
MKKRLYITFLIGIFCIISFLSFSQPGKIDIKFIGNCGFFMTDGKVNLYVDFPYKPGAYGYMTYDVKLLDSVPDHSIFLFTHGHADHYNKKLFKLTRQKLYGPWPVRLFLSGRRKYKLKELNASIPGFSVTEFKTSHRFSLKHCSYLIVWNGKRIFISGDTGSTDTVGNMKNLDMVIAPSWLIINAHDSNLKIDTKKIILCHHRSGEIINNHSEKIIVPRQNQVIELK